MQPKQVVCCLFFLLFIVLLFTGLSFSTLSPLEAGIRLNIITSKIPDGEDTFTAGRHFVGPTYKFIKYPTTLQTITFSADNDGPEPNDGTVLAASTKGGQTVYLELSFQFRLMTSRLLELYRKYEQNYRARFVTIVASTIKEISTRYDTTDYFTDREAIAKVMHAAANTRLQEYFAVVEHFQLKNIDVPRETDNTILDKLNRAQGVREATAIQESQIVRVKTQFEVATRTQAAALAVSLADKEAALITNQAAADAISVDINATARAYKLLKTELNFTNDELVQYLYLEQIRALGPDDKLALNLPSALFNFAAAAPAASSAASPAAAPAPEKP